MTQELPFLQQVRNAANITLDVLLAGVANTTAVYANGTLVIADANLNFNNTATVNVAVTANGSVQSNIGFNVNTSAVLGNALTVAEEAYAQANSALAVAEAAYAQANTANSGIAIAEAAYGQANTATTNAGTALTVAEEAYGVANAAVSIVASSLGANGYIEWSNGYIEEWGQSSFSSGGTQVNFNKPGGFPTEVFNIQATRQGTGVNAPGEGVTPSGRAHFFGYIGTGAGDLVFYWRANGN